MVSVVVLAGVHATVFFATLMTAPLGFDEAFILQAPLNLVQGNGYSTEDWDWRTGGENLQFDAIVSTGPFVLMPVALSFVLFGVSITAARIVMLPYYAILIGSVFVLGRRIGGRWVGLVAAAAVLALNTRADWPTTVIFGPSDALGEYAAAAMIALALVVLPRHRVLAGLVLGLATLAKFIAFMAVPAFIIAMLLVPIAGLMPSWRARIGELTRFLGMVLAPSVVWELVKLVSVGPSAYLETLIGYARFVFRSGSGVDGSGRVFFLERLARLFSAWHMPTVLAIVLGLALLALALAGISRYFAAGAPTVAAGANRWQRLLAWGQMIPVEVWAAAGTLGVFVLWWSFIASSTFIRHTMPVLLCTIPVVVALALAGCRALWSRRTPLLRTVAVVGVAGIFAVTTFQAAATVRQSFAPVDWTLAQQQETANFVRSLEVDNVQGFGWWASPEVRFLSGVPSTPLGTGDGPLVISPILRALDPANYEVARGHCVDVLYESEGFVVCSVDPDVEPLFPTDDAPNAPEAAE